MMRLTTTAFACVLCATQLCLARAWVPSASSSLSSSLTGRSQRSTSLTSSSRISPAKATVEDTDTTATTSVTPNVQLLPEFQMALDHAVDKLKDAIPAAYHDSMLPLLQHFVTEYMTASQAAYSAGYELEMNRPDKTAARILAAVSYGLQFGTGPNKYIFDVTHTAVRKGDLANNPEIDFYQIGNDFFRSCMDLPHSIVLGQANLKKALAQVAAGENVVMLANHQSEADPQVVSCCLEMLGDDVPGAAEQAANVVYVAGHKVTTDALAIPFSMGRNLLCIHSKKHIDADKESKPVKQRQNLRAMSGLLKKLKSGSTLLWVAPSGGRDRRNVETGKVPLAPFDSKTIDMFRLMGNKSKVKTHYYTFAMVSYDLCPPPDFVEAGTGESRQVRFVPVGIALGDEIESIGGLEGRHEFCEHAFKQCTTDYELLEQGIENKLKESASKKE
jgi:glycerol-3-phosphate O-acyltransferase